MSVAKTAQSSTAKILIGFVLGASVAGGIAVAEVTNSPTIKACADNRNQTLYLSKDGTCAKSRTLVEFGTAGGSLKSIVQKVSPSVVSISVTTATGGDSGSGSIIQTNSKTSYVVTNNHVVEPGVNGGTIKVELNNGELYTATIVGRDPSYDLAVLQIPIGNLPVMSIGDSDSLSIGDGAIAFGSPLGLSGTVTSGIVSALNRAVTTGSTGSESYMDAIQTDAAINPGNSGGALTDMQGRMIGINSAIATLSNSSSQSGSIGLGFAIPINQAKRVYQEIIKTGKATRPLLGVYFDQNYNDVGAKILSVTPGDGADKAGIPAGSIITSINGFKIPDDVTAIVRIRAMAPGDSVKITVTMPDGTSKTFTVVLGSAPTS